MTTFIRTDAVRRAGDFAEAAREAERFTAESPEGILAEIARFRTGLAQKRDASRYTVAEATEPA